MVEVEGPNKSLQPSISGAEMLEPSAFLSLKVTLNLFPSITWRGGFTVNETSANNESDRAKNNITEANFFM